MEEDGLLTDGNLYVEFGAGRARLTTYLMEAISNQPNSHFILVDRDHARNKVSPLSRRNARGLPTHVGEHVAFPLLNRIVTLWCLVAHSVDQSLTQRTQCSLGLVLVVTGYRE